MEINWNGIERNGMENLTTIRSNTNARHHLDIIMWLELQ